MSPVRLPDEDDLRTPLFRKVGPRRKKAAKVPPKPPREPHREEDTESTDDAPRTSKEDER